MRQAIYRVEAGISEKQLVSFIKHEAHKKGLKRFSFYPIVASGHRSVLPHGRATHKKKKRGELVVIDIGFKYEGHCSDLTRTVVIGRPTKKQERLYRLVRRAQLAALGKVKDGMRCCEVDLAARNVIKKAGYGEHFVHATGHGIGRKVHQSPRISSKNRRRLKAGMVITIEPGIYLKGFGGIRIEDMVLVTKSGYKLLTQAPYRLD